MLYSEPIGAMVVNAAKRELIVRDCEDETDMISCLKSWFEVVAPSVKYVEVTKTFLGLYILTIEIGSVVLESLPQVASKFPSVM
jgi:hypothetical protein